MEKKLNYIAGAFIGLIFLVIIFVTAVLPATTFNPKPTEVAFNYAEADPGIYRGRLIYQREGCFYCHTQFVRYQDREAGEMVAAGDYVYETPHLLGTERTGPDLSNIGGKYPDAWHKAHHINPRKVKPGSIMPSYSYLSEQDMNDLVAYLQTVGRKRKMPDWISAPQEFRDHYKIVEENAGDVNASAFANAGRGIYLQNCAVCHGVSGRGNGPVSSTMVKKPANFTRPFYTNYSDDMWFWRIAEGVPGTRMPRWNKTLSDEDIYYLVAYLKTLQVADDTASSQIEVTGFSQLDNPEVLSRNFEQIETLNSGHDKYSYGGGRSH